MGLTATLTDALDCRALGDGLIDQLAGPAANLVALVLPVSPAQLGGVTAASGRVNASPVAAAAAQLAGRVPDALAALPLSSNVVQPITALLDLGERLAANDLPAMFDSALAQVQGELARPGGGGHAALLLRVAEVLRNAPEGQALASLLGALVPNNPLAAGLEFPLLDILRGVEAGSQLLGGLMGLDTVLSEAERLSALLGARLDPQALLADGSALAAWLLGAAGGGPAGDAGLVARVQALSVADAPALAAMLNELVEVGVALAALRERCATGLGLGEATLTYLDIDTLRTEIETTRATLRSTDADPARRVAEALARLLAPLLGFNLGALADGPAGGLAALLATVEAQVATLAASLDALDVDAITAPLASGVASLTAPLRALQGLINDALQALRSALDAVRAVVSALPLDALADALRSFVAPVADALDAVTALLADIEAALQTAADATGAALNSVDAALDGFTQQMDALFGQAQQAVDQVDLDALMAQVAQAVQQFAAALGQASLQPVFNTAVSAINGATDVVQAVPFGLLPESMKAEVDAAVAPIKAVDAEAVGNELRSTLGIRPGQGFALRADLEAAVAGVVQRFQALLAVVDANHPRTLLATLDARIDGLAEQVRTLQPDLTLQPLREALDSVKQAVAGIDLTALLQPINDAFDQITGALDGLSVAALVAPVQQRLDAVRADLKTRLHLADWDSALAGLRTEAVALLGRADPAQLRAPLEAALAELTSTLAQFPSRSAAGSLGTLVAGLLSASGRRIQPASFASVLAWLARGAAADAASTALSARSAALALALDTAHGLVTQADPAAVARQVNPACAQLVSAVQALRGRLDAAHPSAVVLQALLSQLDSAAPLAELASGQARYLAQLAAARTRAQAFQREGYAEADVAVAALRRSTAPLDPAAGQVRALFRAIGIPPQDISVAGVLRQLLAAAPPERLVGLVLPIFAALHRRAERLIDGVLDPLRAAGAELGALLDAVDLAPLVEGADAIVATARSEIAALNPSAILVEPLASFSTLRAAIVDADPLATVSAILANLQALIARVLDKLNLERLLATPLAIYDDILAQLHAVDPSGLLTPLYDQLDAMARQIDTGMTDTITGFQRLQDALPTGGGGSTGGVSVG